LNDSSRIDIAGDNVSAGHLLSLGWYAVHLSLFTRDTSIWTKRGEGKENSNNSIDLVN